MSEITDMIESYRRGEIAFDRLRDELANREYATPSRFDPDDPDSTINNPYDSDPVYGEEGTWDEVEKAYWGGLLTDEEYDAISDAADAANETKHGKRPPVPPEAPNPTLEEFRRASKADRR
jgi:hypothetical protein